MRRIALRTLVAVCSLSLAGPPGWCCYVIPTPCCSPKADHAKAPGKEQAKTKCPHCCGTDESAPQPRPSERPARPEKPLPGCCCDHLPPAPRSVEKKLPQPVAALGVGIATSPPAAVVALRSSEPEATVVPG